MNHKTLSGKIGNGWVPSTIFNALAFMVPFIVCQLLVTGYTSVPHNAAPTAEILAETRRDIDRTFRSLTKNDASARNQWAALISETLDQRDMSAARGFLLAAPQMLNASDQRAIRVAADADPVGSEDQRLLRAALLFVPSEIRVSYEASLRPRGVELINIQEETPGVDPVEIADASAVSSLSQQDARIADVSLASMTHIPAFSVLGTVEDLVSRSRNWMRGNRQDAFEMRLTGIAMASPPSATGLDEKSLIEAASILKTAWRSNRLQGQYARLLSQRLAAALPDDTLTKNLELALSDVAKLDVRAQRVQDAFASSIDTLAARRLGPDLKQIAQIASATSPRGALNLLDHVNGPTDVNRARLLVEAGGDRAVALVSQMGHDAFYITGSGIKWSRATVYSILMLTAVFIAMILSALAVMSEAVFGARQDAVL